MKNNNYKYLTAVTGLLLLTVVMLYSCGKVYDLNGEDWEPDLPLSDTVFNREIRVLDLGVNNIPATHRPLDIDDPLFFSLEKINSVHIGYKATTRWDMSFSGNSRIVIAGNNGSNPGFGYGSSGVGGVVVLDSAYSEVTTVPDDSKFQTPGSAGLAGFGEQISPGGYAFYTFFDNIFRPDKIMHLGSSDQALASDANLYLHMIYCISEDFVKTFPGTYAGYKPTPKTLLIRTASGNYAKLEMQSLYKGTMKPIDMRRGTDKPIGYASFRYMVIKKEEKRFGFVARNRKLTVNLSTKTRTVE